MRTTPKALSKVQATKVASLGTTCSKIYYLLDAGYKPSEVRALLNLTCVQHVYNERERRANKVAAK